MPSKSAINCSEPALRHLYEYAVVQFMPSIERGEFVNIGLIMMCKKRRWIQCRFLVNRNRIAAFCPEVDFETLVTQITGFQRVVDGDTAQGGAIAALETHERFRWLTAVRSACLQTSRPHVGLTDHLDDTFNNLFRTLVE